MSQARQAYRTIVVLRKALAKQAETGLPLTIQPDGDIFVGRSADDPDRHVWSYGDEDQLEALGRVLDMASHDIWKMLLLLGEKM